MEQGLRLPFLEGHEPDLDEGLLFYWMAWNTLHPGRQRSMGGPSGISLSEIIAYMDEYGVEGRDDRDFFIEAIQRIDARFRKRTDDESKKASEAISGGR